MNWAVPQIHKQVEVLRRYFPDLGYYDQSIAGRTTPNRPPRGADAWFAIPRIELLGEDYLEATRVVLEVIGNRAEADFRIFRDVDYFSGQTPKCSEIWNRVGEEQAGFGILVVAGQLGNLRHIDPLQPVGACLDKLKENEWPFGALELLVATLIFPGFPLMNQEWIVGLGSQFGPYPHDQLTYFPYLKRNQEGLCFGGVAGQRLHRGLQAATFTLS